MGKLSNGEWAYILDLLAFGYAVEIEGLVPGRVEGSRCADYLVVWHYERLN